MRARQVLPRILVAAGLTAYILWNSHPREVLTVAAHADWAPIGMASLLVILDRTLMAFRWVLLLCIVERRCRPPLPALLRIFFVSTFAGTFLPASVGGDAVRAYSLARLRVRGEDAVASVFMDRILGVASIVLMAVIGLTLAASLTDGRVLAALGGAAGICAGTMLLIFSRRAATAADRLIGGVPVPMLRHAGGRVLGSIRKYASYPGMLANVLACSVAVQAIRVVQAYYLGRSLGIDAVLSTYFAFVPVILLIMLLPVTFNGIGTSQGAFVWFFARAGVSAPAAFALSVLFVALGIVGNLPGGILFALGRTEPRTEPVQSSLERSTR
jgi:glycosyltransferase 2 family protein